MTDTPAAPGEVLSVGGVSYRAEFRPGMLWMEQARDAAGLPKVDASGAPEITRRIVDAPSAGLRIARADGGALGPGDEGVAQAVADAYCAAHPDLARATRFGRSFLYSGGIWTVLEVCG